MLESIILIIGVAVALILVEIIADGDGTMTERREYRV